MSALKYCMVCLTTDVKFSLKEYSFSDIYSALTQLKVNNLDQHLCFQCAGLLMKYQRFKLKCIGTDKILSETIIKPKLTKFHLQTLQNRYNLASNLVISNVITEDIAGSVLPEFNEISNIADIGVPESVHTNFGESDDENDKGMLVLLENDEEKPSLLLESKLEAFTHNVNAEKNVLTSDNKPHNIEILSKQDNYNVICKEDPKGIISSSSSKTKNKSKKKQVLEPKSETIALSSDDESYHSDTSWTNILKTLNRIKSENKELTSNIEEETATANSMLEVEIEFMPDNNYISEINNTEDLVANTTIVNTKTVRKQTKKKIGRPKKDKTLCEKPKKLNHSKYTQNNNTIKNLKKHGTIEILTQEKVRNEMLAMANYNPVKLPYKCDICFKNFRLKDALANHMHKHSPERGVYECDHCHCRFQNKGFITIHMISHHIYKFKCQHDGCLFECNWLYQGTRHVNIHAGKKPKCKFCKLQFKAEHSIFAHMYKEHPNEFETEFFCELCGRIFYSAGGVKLHKLRTHFNYKNDHQGPECKECNVHFATEQAWNLHLVLSRKHEVENGCKYCGKRYDNESDLKTHMKRHRNRMLLSKSSQSKSDNKGQAVCQICKDVFKSEYQVRRHQHFVHGQSKPVATLSKKTHICEICGESFYARSLLTYHRYRHTGERPFKCQYCGKGFRYLAAQKAHENIHTRAEIYKCHVCDKEFLRHTTRAKHVRKCMGKTFHNCVECGQSFVNNSTLKAHILHKHEKVPYPPRKNPRYQRKKHSKPVAEENVGQ